MSKIKSISLYKYDYVLKDIHSEEFELQGGIYNKTTYDPDGRTLSEIKYDAQGGIEQHYGYVYNEKGDKIADRSWDENGELIDDMEYDVDADGRVKFAYKNYLDGSQDTVTYLYDEEGRLTGKEVRSDEDELEMTESYTYDGDHVILHETKNQENEVVYRNEKAYDEDGNVLEEKTWMAETDQTNRVVNLYDDNGNLQSVISYNDTGDIISKVNYERKDDRIVGVREESAERTVLTHLEYDEHGNPVVQEEKNEQGELYSRIERKFDEDGNVTESEAIIDTHGMGRNQHYVLKYAYEFHDV